MNAYDAILWGIGFFTLTLAIAVMAYGIFDAVRDYRRYRGECRDRAKRDAMNARISWSTWGGISKVYMVEAWGYSRHVATAMETPTGKVLIEMMDGESLDGMGYRDAQNQIVRYLISQGW